MYYTYGQHLLNYRKYFLSNFTNILLLFVSLICCSLYFITTMLIAHSFMIVGVSGVTEIKIWKIRLWQAEYTINSFRYRRYPTIRYVMYIYRRTVQYILEINPIFGKTFLVYLLINLPINALFVMNIILGVGSDVFRFATTFIVISQILFIFLVHFLIANRNEKLNNESKQIFNLSFHYRFKPYTFNRLNLYIQTFHTEQQYGITYGNFGTISLFTFTKVKFLFLKICLKKFCHQI